MKLLTFLGVGNYQPTLYEWQSQSFETRFSMAAACHFLKPDSLTLFLTEDAQQGIYPELKAELPPSVMVQTVPVPLGSCDAELWHIFESVSSSVSPGEAVAFDITHGLRSFPLIGLLAAAFLRSGLDVDLRAVLYGAYDVGRQVSPGRTPMFDLSPMLSLLEWSAAADRFNRTGDARYLASIMDDFRRQIAEEAGKDKEKKRQLYAFGRLCDMLSLTSQALRLARPVEAMQAVNGLAGLVEEAQPALERTAAAGPFRLLMERIEATYSQFGMAQPMAAGTLQTSLAVQQQMIAWYMQREQWVQAVTLAREWLVSYVMLKLGLEDLLSRSLRERVSKEINIEAHNWRECQREKTAYRSLFLNNVSGLETVLGLWDALAEVRNDIDHAGMRDNPMSAKKLIERVQYLVDEISKIRIED